MDRASFAPALSAGWEGLFRVDHRGAKVRVGGWPRLSNEDAPRGERRWNVGRGGRVEEGEIVTAEAWS